MSHDKQVTSDSSGLPPPTQKSREWSTWRLPLLIALVAVLWAISEDLIVTYQTLTDVDDFRPILIEPPQ